MTTTLGGRIDHYMQSLTPANDGDVVLTTDDARGASAASFRSTAGAMTLHGSIDGVTFEDEPLAFVDFHATTTELVAVTAAGRFYGIRGIFAKYQLRQSGATPVTGARFLAGWAGMTR